MTSRSANRDLLWILALQLVLVLPFIGQPIHIDDPIFLDIGRNALSHPWHAHDFPYIFEGRLIPDMASHSHPPFVGYWIGLLLLLFGDGPNVHVLLHLGFVVFPLLFAVGMYRLSRRFTAFPALVTTLAICSPAAIVASHTLMTDYPCLAFSVFGVALYVEGVDSGKPRKVWMSALFLALAAFCSYPALAVALLCWLYAWQKRTRMRAAFFAPSIAMLWMAAWLTYSSIYFGRFVLGGTAQYMSRMGGFSVAGLLHKLLALPIFLAAALALPLPIIRSTWREFRGVVAISWIPISGLLVQFAAGDYRLRDRILLTLLLSIGGWIIIGLLLRVRHLRIATTSLESRQDLLFLTAWAVVVIAQLVLLYSSQMGRYMLPLIPALMLLAFFKSSDSDLAFLRRSAVLASLMGLILGLSLAAADFEMARAHRDIARDLGEVFKGRESQVRFGAEWGLRHYMLEQGFRQFTSTGDDDIAGGQFLVTPRQAVPYEFPQDIGAMLIPVRRQAQQVHVPIRLLNRDAHAGLYSSAWGLLPFAISRQPVEEITVQQVSYLNDRLPEITLEGAANGQLLLPVPAPGGGVDIVVPVPNRVRIPYNDALPVRVQFSCIDAGGKAATDCPVRVLIDRDGTQTEAALKTINVDEIPIFAFGVPGTKGQSIVLDFGAASAGTIKIRNWIMLPPEAWR